MYLYEEIHILDQNGSTPQIPAVIRENLNPEMELREYQEKAFCYFVTYFETETLRRKPAQTLFHMATGSGKTLIMAGLILYLYQKGYRNFLFFVNLSNILQKTKENFLNVASPKYLFAPRMGVEGRSIRIQEVENFQFGDPDAINICFQTTQGLHSDLTIFKENGLSHEDFRDMKIALIADEAHHLNVATRAAKNGNHDASSWEETVKKIFEMNPENVLLEFTATCDLNTPAIRNEYENKIVFDYPLTRFSGDRYSKDILTLRSDVPPMDRVLQALILSQYRLKLFESHQLAIKPVVLLKSQKIEESKAFMTAFHEKMEQLDGAEVERIFTQIDDSTLKRARVYFENHGLNSERLAQELKEDFSPQHCISANDDSEAESRQIALNTLESPGNPYRAVFEVKKLDEGWDVLNLFDIVRLYETRQSGFGKPSKTTLSEAQLIGRGARYCPFQLDGEQPRFQRKFDRDCENEMRICETLFYHCQNDSRYIAELNDALGKFGLDLEAGISRKYEFKDVFLNDDIYTIGKVFVNERLEKKGVSTIPIFQSLPQNFTVRLSSGASAQDRMLTSETVWQERDNLSRVETLHEVGPAIRSFRKTFRQLAQTYYFLIHSALRKIPFFRFDTLKKRFPDLNSTRELITDDKYLGEIQIEIQSDQNPPSGPLIYRACLDVLTQIAEILEGVPKEYEGSREFKPLNIRDVFRQKTVRYARKINGSEGCSQNDPSVARESRMDLRREDWFAFQDNYGTSEEKAFVAWFKLRLEPLRKIYNKVFLVRNERCLKIYAFETGDRFEPDYVLFLQKKNGVGMEQLQVFIEPKGNHLLQTDCWKENFLLQLERSVVVEKDVKSDDRYRILGFHFFNQDNRMEEIIQDFEKIEASPSASS